MTNTQLTNNQPGSITNIPNIAIGHWTNRDAITGCTVILCPSGAVAGVDVRGGAPGSREHAMLDPTCTVDQVHAILLSGGSAFGLAAADGVMRWLEEYGYGFDVGVARVPIVPGAIIFDLGIGRADVRPQAQHGYDACVAASVDAMETGSVGAGTGATVGKLLGFGQATKGGIGTASRKLNEAGADYGDGAVIAALVVVNAIGNVIDPQTNRIIAGVRNPDHKNDASTEVFLDATEIMQQRLASRSLPAESSALQNTTIGVVATNLPLDKAGATKVAQMAHDGLARVINPIHTSMDGDTIFAISTASPTEYKSISGASIGAVGAIAAEVVADAVLHAITSAESLGGVPTSRTLLGDYNKGKVNSEK
ncbi:MAG: P1 family peptidase [Chloroflexota bacterium]